MAKRLDDKDVELLSLAHQAWAIHLLGDSAASILFKQAELLELDSDPDVAYLTRLSGVHYADHLIRVGNVTYAREVTDANLKYCKRNSWSFLVSMCHRVLGDLDADLGDNGNTEKHFNQALKIARVTNRSDILIAALVARGRWIARNYQDVTGLNQAFADLNEALDYSAESGYRIYEVDVRVALAWAHSSTGDKSRARIEAEYAHHMSKEMGYYWGKIDSEEVIDTLEKSVYE
jgi:hypothetical protein